MSIMRHINRGDIKEGGCPMCKPRHRRQGSYTLPKDLLSVQDDIEEGLADFMTEDHSHTPYEDWTFDV